MMRSLSRWNSLRTSSGGSGTGRPVPVRQAHFGVDKGISARPSGLYSSAFTPDGGYACRERRGPCYRERGQGREQRQPGGRSLRASPPRQPPLSGVRSGAAGRRGGLGGGGG